MRANLPAACFLVLTLLSGMNGGAANADVFDMGGTRNPYNGTWTGLASLEFVTVGNAGNPGEQSRAIYNDYTYYGSVGYDYQIGKYEVTAGQYTEFLNAVAQTDPFGLYNTQMWSKSEGCKIQRIGSSGSYTYSVAPSLANRPVNYVSIWDAARFVNWLNNGQGSDTTESAYRNVGNQGTFARQPDAKYWIPTYNEWYKAAYYDGVTGDYYYYPTSSDTIDPSMANYGLSVGHSTDVGAYGYASPYGTFDQGGNLWEWNETADGSGRGMVGGSWWNHDATLGSWSGSGSLGPFLRGLTQHSPCGKFCCRSRTRLRYGLV